MDILHQEWRSGMVWVPPPVRLVLFIVLVLLLAARGVPLLIRLWAAGLHHSGPVLEWLTFPEYLATTAARRQERPLLPGTFAYGRLLGAVHRGSLALGGVLLKAGRRQPALRKSLFVLPAILVLAVWYSAAALPPGEFGDAVRDARSGLATMDLWLIGQVRKFFGGQI